VREVFAEIGADKVPELIVINKADAADPMVIARLLQREPHSVVVSAKTGEGIEEALRPSSPSCPGRRWSSTCCALRARRPRQPDPPGGRDRLHGHTATAPSWSAAPTPTWPASSRRTP
jgi:hypothetical protein